MKVKMINGLFNTEMWVAEDRVEEYEAAGHKRAEKKKEPAKAKKKKSRAR